MTAYIVHVGPPKTGTTYLQKSFHLRQSELLKMGVYYPSEIRSGDQLAHHGLIDLLKQRSSPVVESTFARLNSGDYQKVLISTEGFPSLGDPELHYFRTLIDAANAEIVFYCRRWSDWIPSAWQQSVKQGSVETFPEFYGRFIAMASAHFAINYSRILARYASVFGNENIRLVSYSNVLDGKGDIFEVFCNHILKLPMRSPGRENLNRSASIYEIELSRIMNIFETKKFERPGISLHIALLHALRRKSSYKIVELLMDGMRNSVQTIVLDDNAPTLRPIYDEISSQFGKSIVASEYGSTIFRKQKKEVQFVKQDYLLNNRMAAALEQLYLDVKESDSNRLLNGVVE